MLFLFCPVIIKLCVYFLLDHVKTTSNSFYYPKVFLSQKDSLSHTVLDFPWGSRNGSQQINTFLYWYSYGLNVTKYEHVYIKYIYAHTATDTQLQWKFVRHQQSRNNVTLLYEMTTKHQSINQSLNQVPCFLKRKLSWPQLFSFDHSSYRTMFQVSLLITWPKKRLPSVYVFYLWVIVVSASLNTVSFDFFAVHEICKKKCIIFLLEPHIYYLQLLL